MKTRFISQWYMLISLICLILINSNPLDTIAETTALNPDRQLSERLTQDILAVRQGATQGHGRDLTHLLLEAKRHWNELTPQAQELLKPMMDRPIGLDSYYRPATGFFQFWFTLSDDDAVDPTDENSNDIPDYIESMAAEFENIKGIYSQAGFNLPPKVDADGYVSNYYDVYISSSEAGDGVYGYVSGEYEIGDNPTSTITEYNSISSFMVMRSEYTDFGETPQARINAMKVTAAHEFFHSVQMGYDGLNMTGFLMEISSTWSEDWVYPGLDDNFQYLPTLFQAPDIALDYRDNSGYNDEFNGHWYSSWLYMRYLTEHTSPAVIRDMYENCITMSELAAMDAALSNYGNSFFNSVVAFYMAMGTLSSNSSVCVDLTFSRAEDYRAAVSGVSFENTLAYSGSPVSYTSDGDGNGRLMRFGADYIKITATQNFSVTLEHNNNEMDAAALILKMDRDNNPTRLGIVNGEQQGNIITLNVDDASQYSSFILTIVNLAETTDDVMMDYALEISQGQTSVAEIKPNPADHIQLYTNYPNPFNSSTMIRYYLPCAQTITIDLYDLLGNRIERVFEGAKPAGEHSLLYQSRNLSSGQYFLRLNTQKGIQHIKLSYLK